MRPVYSRLSVCCANPSAGSKSSWDSLKSFRVPEWYQNAKFGIFIHWGLYSVPAFNNEWYPRNMYREGTEEFKHHVETYGPHTEFGYKDFIPMFKAEKYDPDAAKKLLAEAERPLTLKDLTAEVGAHLGNTPAMARKSYIHPAVIALVERQQKWRAKLKLPRESKWLSSYERALIRLLERGPGAAKLLAD